MTPSRSDRYRSIQLLRGAFSSAFSIGQGYERQPLNEAARYDVVERYYLDLRAKTDRPITRVFTGHGHVLPPSATTFAQEALGWSEKAHDGAPRAADAFLSATTRLLEVSEPYEDALIWPYEVPVPKYGISGRWFSAMAQGQAASVLVRAHLQTGKDEYGQAAIAAAKAMTHLGGRLGITRQLGPDVIYEECPTDEPSMILNGWIFALWGLYDVAVGLASSPFRTAFETGAATLARRIGEFDYGWWSRYSLFRPRAPDLAKPSYQTLHADQLEVMYRLTGTAAFLQTAERWRRMDTPVNRARAVFLKGREVLGAPGRSLP